MFWTLSNILSIVRGLLVVPLAFALLNNNSLSVIIICITAVLTDILDGYFARKFKQETEYGRIIDPLADKIFIGAMVIILSMLGKIPPWFLISIITRDVLIFTGGMYIKKRNGYVLPSNYAGKIAVVCVSFVLLGFALNWGTLTMYLLWISVVAMIVSLVLYTNRFIAILKTNS
ncbi:MAG: CDP-alcohol phosphatidyltransferase family protein [Ignavibacteria bacterium]|nr:CDP-alcohol phosphatidyltransferase family protein [Ignavibacteria bacterium]